MATKQKFRGSFEDFLTEVFLQLGEHEDHFLLYSLKSLDWAEIRCSACRSVVIDGSRDLIESLWLEVNYRSWS
jgi:hypothetical protein